MKTRLIQLGKHVHLQNAIGLLGRLLQFLVQSLGPLALHFLQIFFLSQMNQVPMEGSSPQLFSIPIQFDLESIRRNGHEHRASTGEVESLFLGIAGSGSMWYKRKFFQLSSLAIGILASVLLLRKISDLRKWAIASGKQLHVSERKVYFGTARTSVLLVTAMFAMVHIAMLVTDRSKMLTKELLMMTSVVALTCLLYLTLLFAVALPIIIPVTKSLFRNFIARARNAEVFRNKNHVRLALAVVACVAFIKISVIILPHAPNPHQSLLVELPRPADESPAGWSLSEQFFRTATGDSFDICKSQGIGRYSNKIRYGVTWPRYLPRRLLNFFTGTESCGGTSEADYRRRAATHIPLPITATLSEKRNLMDFRDDNELPIGELSALKSQIDALAKEDAERFFEVPAGRRKAFPLPGRKFSEYDRGTSELLVPAICPETRVKPTIILEDLRRNQLGNGFENIFPETLKREFRPFHRRWPHKLISKYVPLCNNVTWQSQKAQFTGDLSAPCTIHWTADKLGKMMLERVTQSVLPGLQRVPPNHATAKSLTSNALRKNDFILPVPTLPFDHYRLPLMSEAVSVFCGDEEEYHVHPIFEVITGSVTEERMPRNLLVLVLDAVSRQEMLRTLPLTASFLKRHYDLTNRYAEIKNAMASHTAKVPVQEWKGYTTIGHSTSMNLAPVVGGDVMNHNRAEAKSLAESNIFHLVKNKYGNTAFVSVVSGTCGHTTDMLAGSNEKDDENDFNSKSGSKIEGGAGGPFAFTDKDHFASMCHIDYGGLEGNFQGPYSIKRRCIGGKHVHDHVIDYTDDLLFTILFGKEQKAKSVPDSLLHMSYFLEGHEGTHAVLNLIDLSLYRFLRRLEIVFGFFEDSRNLLLLLSDHGNHMGPYFEWSPIGAAERSTPIAIFLGSPVGKTPSEMAASNISSHSLTTPFDLHLTIKQVLDIGSRSLQKYPKAKSFIDSAWLSGVKRRTCEDAQAYSSCIMSYCDNN